ncbi:MAG: hypothetical protein P4M11_14865 [Candidatus Pacebacteria bacterium]|nr:hypothetical protein [Candidatus Paceibacterota bacterium]
MNRALQRTVPAGRANLDSFAPLAPTTNPLFLMPTFTCIARFCDGEQLCSMVQTCQYFRSVIMLIPRLEATLWKHRYHRLAKSYDSLKQKERKLKAKEEEKLDRGFLDIAQSSVVLPKSNEIKASWKKSARIEDIANRFMYSRNKELIMQNLKKMSEMEKDSKMLNDSYSNDMYERYMLKQVSKENASALTVAENVIDYSVYSLHKKFKKQNYDVPPPDAAAKEKIKEYDKKIYGVAKSRLIDKPMSK